MAFQTLRGESGVDFIGTDGVDALFVINEPENNVVSGGEGVIKIDAEAGNDNVDLTNESGVTGNAEVKLGAGNDILTMGGNAINRLNRLVDSFVNGGLGNDDIFTEGSVGSILRGNEDDDDFFLVSNYTGTKLNGNSGNDSFTLLGAVTLSDTKILGGADADGQMDLTGFPILGVDAVIQGGKGGDNISIGDLSNGSSGIRVSGGADNDTITVSNSLGTDNVAAYNGADGRDNIIFTNVNSADAVTKGGEGDDRFNIDGSGKIEAIGEAGNDYFTINVASTAKHTLNGGLGSDTYDTFSVAAVTYEIPTVSESPAALTGTTKTFDIFDQAIDNTNFDDVIDITGGAAQELVGNRLSNDEVGAVPAALTTGAAIDTGSFAGLVDAVDGLLTASDPNIGNNLGQLNFDIVSIDGDGDNIDEGIDGRYLIINNTNTILDSGDMMFQLAAVDAAAALLEATQISLAIEAGF